jgi:hypothetical protein
MRIDPRARRIAAELGWLAAAMVIALGAGGVVAYGDRPAGDATRPELTASADAATEAALAPVLAGLDELRVKVTQLGRTARAALGELNARDIEGVRARLDEGDAQLDSIISQAGRLALAFDALPHRASSDRIGEQTRTRLEAVDRALRSVVPVRDAWQALADGSRPAAALLEHLETHDRLTFQATQQGVDEEYPAALRTLRRAMAQLDRAIALRDQLINTVDVETLDEWLLRNRDYDRALRRLYRALRATRGEVDAEVREAFAEVERRQRLLPPDTRALVIVMADIAEGGLNQATVAIEQARGRLASATAALH